MKNSTTLLTALCVTACLSAYQLDAAATKKNISQRTAKVAPAPVNTYLVVPNVVRKKAAIRKKPAVEVLPGNSIITTISDIPGKQIAGGTVRCFVPINSPNSAKNEKKASKNEKQVAEISFYIQKEEPVFSCFGTPEYIGGITAVKYDNDEYKRHIITALKNHFMSKKCTKVLILPSALRDSEFLKSIKYTEITNSPLALKYDAKIATGESPDSAIPLM